ncbi:hypothetical protein F0562_030587 [Nyssa sinensis]|uniref:Uncharacterized protein n=1 Tax=Nyssa sinensis TaxID=561372 RepID=A0A5J5AYQ5_9ASTE|nr:hypothetical protein F0562_030587 [Nyssa sinensis]
MGTVPPYYLKPLSNEDSWVLFRRLAFDPSQDEEKARLEEIGRRIVIKCRGLPLAVKTLGGLMRFKRQESEWMYVMKEDMWKLTEFESNILPVLMLSYHHLPPHPKQCFAYCSIFPKDYVINKQKLIKLWIAQGFVLPINGIKILEDIGNDYFMELLERSFFTGIVRDDYGDIVQCGMHDLVHDLALFIARNSCWIVETEFPGNISKELRHCSLVSVSRESTIPQELHQAKNLRTLILLSGEFKNLSSFFPMFRCLRVLDLSQSSLRKLPVSVGNLKHLRYLDLSHTYIKTLPKTISILKKLQILELCGCYSLLELPKAISELINLRHLGIQSCSLLSHMPYGIGKLSLLQTLPTFILGNTRGCGSLSELRSLNLRGRLEIKNLENVRNLAEADAVELYDKLNLHSLGLSWGDNFDWRMSAEVLESLRPPPALRVLDIIGYGAPMFPSWLQDGILKLIEVSLINCYCQSLPPLGQLPYLRNLYIKGLSKVKTIGLEFYGDPSGGGFPSLQQFKLSDMPILSEWRSPELEKNDFLTRSEESSNYIFEQAFPRLHTLSVKGGSRLTNLPLLPNLRKLALSNCNPMLLGSLAHLTSLSSLVFDEFREPTFLSTNLGRLNSVRTLTIYDCDGLISLLEEGMQEFTALEYLSIFCCHKLKSLPMGLRYLTSLKKLEIVDCQELVNIPDVLQFLSSLKEFVIEGCPNLDSLPDSMQNLINLRKVVIKRCPRLERKLDVVLEKEFGEFILEDDN